MFTGCSDLGTIKSRIVITQKRHEYEITLFVKKQRMMAGQHDGRSGYGIIVGPTQGGINTMISAGKPSLVHPTRETAVMRPHGLYEKMLYV